MNVKYFIISLQKARSLIDQKINEHSFYKQVTGLYSALGPFWVEFARSLCAPMGFLRVHWFPPTDQKHACYINW